MLKDRQRNTRTYDWRDRNIRRYKTIPQKEKSEKQEVNIMANFNEYALELSIIELLQNKGYIHQTGSELLREKSEVLIVDDLKEY